MGNNLWNNRDPGALLVSPFPASQATPAGVPEIYVPLVSYPELGASGDGFSAGDWATIGLVGLGLVGLGVLIARSR